MMMLLHVMLGRTKKWFSNDNCPDLKIGRCSSRQAEVRMRHELLGDTSEVACKALTKQVVAVSANKFPTF